MRDSKSYLSLCSNAVALACLVDYWRIEKRDMQIHHILVLFLADYMNRHTFIEDREAIISTILSSEISTIFLSLHSILPKKWVWIGALNNALFISTFFHYRIYVYSQELVFNPNVHATFLFSSMGWIQIIQIYIGVLGLFVLNLYWARMILHKCISVDATV